MFCHLRFIRREMKSHGWHAMKLTSSSGADWENAYIQWLRVSWPGQYWWWDDVVIRSPTTIMSGVALIIERRPSFICSYGRCFRFWADTLCTDLELYLRADKCSMCSEHAGWSNTIPFVVCSMFPSLHTSANNLMLHVKSKREWMHFVLWVATMNQTMFSLFFNLQLLIQVVFFSSDFNDSTMTGCFQDSTAWLAHCTVVISGKRTGLLVFFSLTFSCICEFNIFKSKINVLWFVFNHELLYDVSMVSWLTWCQDYWGLHNHIEFAECVASIDLSESRWMCIFELILISY